MSDDNTWNVIRISKISAIVKRFGRHYILTDGGHRIRVKENAAARLFLAVNEANNSDESFFSRRG